MALCSDTAQLMGGEALCSAKRVGRRHDLLARLKFFIAVHFDPEKRRSIEDLRGSAVRSRPA